MNHDQIMELIESAKCVEEIRALWAMPTSTVNLDAMVDINDLHNAAAPIENWPNPKATGGPKNTIPNFQHMLEVFQIQCRYNVIRKEVEIISSRMPTTADNLKDAAFIQIKSLAAFNSFPQNQVREYLLAQADSNPFNPIMTFIGSKPWDGVTRFNTLLSTMTLAPGFDVELAAILLRKWLISAVAAVAKPKGFHSRGILVLQGPQGCGKTSWFRQLLHPSIREYFKEGALIDPAIKDTLITAITHWIVELGELDATFRRTDVARLKAFTTQTEDKIRRPYGHTDEKYSRRMVICASVNETESLVDSTGNSRFWVIPVNNLNYQHDIDMQQLFAEVYEMYKSGEIWWLDSEEERRLEESNASYRQFDAIEEMMFTYFGRIPENPATKWMTTTEFLKNELGIREPNKAQLQTAGKVLTRMGLNKNKTNKSRQYEVPVNPVNYRTWQ